MKHNIREEREEIDSHRRGQNREKKPQPAWFKKFKSRRTLFA